MQRLAPTALSLALALTGFACGEAQDAEPPVDTTPVVGALEIPISRNHQAPAPSGAALIELSPSQLRLDHRDVLPLERGRVADGEVADSVITKLREALASAPARAQAALWVNANVPYLTLAQVMKTLESTGVREVSFAVRRGTTNPETGWMKVGRWRVVPAGDEPVEFEGVARPWSSFVEKWREMYTACRASSAYIDCDSPLPAAEGGELQVRLWARGQGMKMTFMQVNVSEEEAAAPSARRGPELIEGVQAAPVAAPVEEEPKVTEGSFNFRHQDSVADESAFSNTAQLLCGTESCPVVVDADATTPSMRVLSMLGAFYANGFTEPTFAFRVPALR